MLQLMDPQEYVGVKPIRVTLGVARAMGLEEGAMTGVHRGSMYLTGQFHRQNSSVRGSFILPFPLTSSSLYCLRSFAFSRMPHGWNQAEGSLFRCAFT